MKSTKLLKLKSIILLLFISSFTFAQQSLSLNAEVDRVQPMTGIVFWAENESALNSLGNKTQLEYSYLVYSDVVENEGVYDWGVVDDLLSTAAARGRQVILRFRYTYPGETTPSVPTYIRNRSDYTDIFETVEGSRTFIPDWSNSTLEDFTLEFFTKFAARYDNDARLAYVQVGFGSYSEYHLYDGPLRFGDTFPTKDYQTTFLQHVNTVFNETQWSISIDAGSDEYTPIAGSNSLLNLGYGLFDDSFLHEEHSTSNNEYNRSNWLTFGADRANNYAAGGELNYYSTRDQETVLNVEGPYGFTFEEMSEMYDISYMIGNDQLNYQTTARIEDAGMATGYHYQVIAYSTNGSTTSVTIKNNGIAPIYYDAYPTVGGVKSTTSLKGLLAGQSKDFTINTSAAGEDLTISCNRLVPGQEIQFDAALDGETITATDILTLSTVATFSASAEAKTITVTSNQNWTASESSSWLSINTTSGSNNGSITITASENTSTNSRSGVLTVSGGNITRTLTIEQNGADIINLPTALFIPDPNKTYYIDSPHHNLRLAATGESEDAETTSINTTGTNVEWKFVAKTGIEGSWHIQLAAGGSLPRLRTDNIDDNADMQPTTSSGVYTYFNFEQGAIDDTYFITLTNGPSNYQRLQINNSGQVKMVTTASNGTWESFRITEVDEETITAPATSCTQGTNLSLNATIVDFSTEQNTTNTVDNILDGLDTNRWSANGFSQFAVIDLGDEYPVNAINLLPHDDRAYQFLIEGSVSSANAGFFTLTDATGNTSGGSQITKNFNTQTVRYVKLTITGASVYNGTWSSIKDFQVLCAGSSSNKNLFADSLFEATAYPNPFLDTINVQAINLEQQIGAVHLVDMNGSIVVKKETSDNDTTLDNLGELANGMYLLQVFNTQEQILKIIKVVKE